MAAVPSYNRADQPDIGERRPQNLNRNVKQSTLAKNGLPAIGETTHSRRRNCIPSARDHTSLPPPRKRRSVGCNIIPWRKKKEARAKPPTWAAGVTSGASQLLLSSHQLITVLKKPRGDAEMDNDAKNKRSDQLEAKDPELRRGSTFTMLDTQASYRGNNATSALHR